MKTWKWALFLAMAGALALTFVACGSGGGGDDDSSGGNDDDVADDDSIGGDDDTTASDTWTDSTSGLTWQVTPPSDSMTGADATTYCQNLTLAGGGWRLPTISELRSLIRGCDATVTGGSCGITDECLSYHSCFDSSCGSCYGYSGPAGGCFWPSEMQGDCLSYRSSSALADSDYPDYTWYVSFDYGMVGFFHCYSNDVRCVR